MEQIQNQGDVVQTEIKSQEPVDNGNSGQIPNSPKARNGRMLKLNWIHFNSQIYTYVTLLIAQKKFNDEFNVGAKET